MNLADIMYNAQTQMNEWSSLSTEQEEMLALYAKIAHLNKQLKQANKNKTKPKEENKNKKKGNDKDREWMKEKPKGDEKKVNGHSTWTMGKKSYFWCSHHNNEQGLWVIHNPDECKNKPTTAMEKKEEAEQATLPANFDTVDNDEEE